MADRPNVTRTPEAMSTTNKHLDVRIEHGLGDRLFAEQRALVLALSLCNLLSGPSRQLLEGLTNLLDSVADQAHEQGEDCLLRASEDLPDLLAHLRAQVLAALPGQLPESRAELADLIARALAGAPPRPAPPAGGAGAADPSSIITACDHDGREDRHVYVDGQPVETVNACGECAERYAQAKAARLREDSDDELRRRIAENGGPLPIGDKLFHVEEGTGEVYYTHAA